MSEIKITTNSNDTVRCRSYFNNDLDQGIEIFMGSERLGSMLFNELPDEDCEESMKCFINKVEDWLIENY